MWLTIVSLGIYGCSTSRAGAPDADKAAGGAAAVPAVATGEKAAPPGSAAPTKPDAPVLKAMSGRNVLVTTPALPDGATSFTLQRKGEKDADSAYRTVARNLKPKSGVAVTGLKEGTAYAFRYLAVGQGGSTAGDAATLTTDVSPAAPAAPVCKAMTKTNLLVTTPDLPEHAASFTLQQKGESEKDSAYKTVATNLKAKTGVAVTSMKEGGYAFRVLAVGPGGTARGEAVTIAMGAEPAADDSAPASHAKVPTTSTATVAAKDEKSPAATSNTKPAPAVAPLKGAVAAPAKNAPAAKH